MYALVLRAYFSIRNSWFVWYYVLNRRARALFAAHPPTLNSIQQRIVDEMRREGIAFSSLDELFPGENKLAELQQWVATHDPLPQTSTKKKFLHEYWETVPELDLTNPFIQLGLSDMYLDTANAYYGMWSRYSLAHLAKIEPDLEAGPVFSQNWHRDPEEKRYMKVFMYLNDVDESAGPFTYIRQSAYGLKFGRLFMQQPPRGSYPSAADVEAAIPAEYLKVCTGKAGTVIFCDPAGLHFGGRAKLKPRIMFTAGYSSMAFSEGARFTINTPAAKAAVAALPPAKKFATSGRLIRAGVKPMH
jgi:hypothetical protein